MNPKQCNHSGCIFKDKMKACIHFASKAYQNAGMRIIHLNLSPMKSSCEPLECTVNHGTVRKHRLCGKEFAECGKMIHHVKVHGDPIK